MNEANGVVMRDDWDADGFVFQHLLAGLITGYIWIGGAFAGAGAVWGGALQVSIVWSIVVGASAGAIPATISGIAVGTERSRDRRREMTVAASAKWGPIALLVGVIGGVVWLVRAII